MKKMVKSTLILALTASTIGTTLVAQAATRNVAHPHPTYLDEWIYGVTDTNYAYSNYFLKANTNLGSYAVVKDAWGNIKSQARANYGWAEAGATKTITWVRAEAGYGWYRF